jgi:hypothetical protein
MIIMPMMLMLNTSAKSGHDTFGITLLHWRRSFFFGFDSTSSFSGVFWQNAWITSSILTRMAKSGQMFNMPLTI